MFMFVFKSLEFGGAFPYQKTPYFFALFLQSEFGGAFRYQKAPYFFALFLQLEFGGAFRLSPSLAREILSWTGKLTQVSPLLFSNKFIF